jgi:hypothetical protein
MYASLGQALPHKLIGPSNPTLIHDGFLKIFSELAISVQNLVICKSESKDSVLRRAFSELGFLEYDCIMYT